MTNKERWLSSAALLISILPFILVAGSIQLLPDSIVLPNIVLAEDVIRLPKYRTCSRSACSSCACIERAQTRGT